MNKKIVEITSIISNFQEHVQESSLFYTSNLIDSKFLKEMILNQILAIYD